jgi:hypothetical protein
MGDKIKELAAAAGRIPGFREAPVGDLRKLLPERGVLLAFLHK